MSYKYLCFLLFLCVSKISAQRIQGYVYDTNTDTPLMGASVYLNGTTVGTLSDENGKFVIDTDQIINASLAISYVGYTTETIRNPYRTEPHVVVLQQKTDDLNEIVIRSDSWTWDKKFHEFKKQFLGSNRAGGFCVILNEDDLDLWFHEESKTLKASADVPLRIRNNLLGYEIEYHLDDFQAVYEGASRSTPYCSQVYYKGSSFYKDLTSNPVALARFKKNRQEEFKGSMAHFFRSLLRNNLKKEGFYLYYNSTPINGYKVFDIEPKKDRYIVTFKRNFLLEYKRKNEQTMITKLNPNMPLAVFPDGNYLPPDSLFLDGHLFSERIGNSLPIDYKPNM
ncbi:carboxypeptidase-like regulatory domain-containing protein [Aureisphaera galaxeae]|uniref:carboxypeptidase-like regulatory domain-containing protein n=1 Tax=Aureisphaera galaxeae TaxID=1538023 RepID=UPI00234FB9C4|nr:carboxypeptidase-like regulatory domain-containing protein [Aureisphaera galaxeae]MDC8004027.1 carboxypeptidase-like regulatory domain-containing protein [Aureisphaera galaxeae]